MSFAYICNRVDLIELFDNRLGALLESILQDDHAVQMQTRLERSAMLL